MHQNYGLNIRSQAINKLVVDNSSIKGRVMSSNLVDKLVKKFNILRDNARLFYMEELPNQVVMLVFFKSSANCLTNF